MFLLLNEAKFRILHNKQFLDRKCGIRNCWLDDSYILGDVGVMCALFQILQFLK